MTPSLSSDQEIAQCLSALAKTDGTTVVPTDTTYGLICRLDHPAAIEKIYEIKQRDYSKPLIILGADYQSLLPWAASKLNIIEALAKTFWPGALTVVAQASKKVPTTIMAGKNTIGMRVPDHEATGLLLSQLPDGCAASTSANLSGTGIPANLSEVREQIGDNVDYIMDDCGQCPARSESTIVDISGEQAVILRAGAIKPDVILAFINQMSGA